MVVRSFLEALRFGAPGGAALGLALALMPTSGPGVVNALGEGFAPLVVSVIAALIGWVVAYVALLLASMSADLVNRTMGVLVACCVAFGASSLSFGGGAVLVAAYAGVVAWFRIPRILGG